MSLNFLSLILFLFSNISQARAGSENFNLALSHIEKFNYPEAAQLLEKEILDPSHGSKAATLLLDSLFKMKSYKEVQNVANRFLNLHPLHFDSRLKLVESYKAQGQLDKAFEESSALIRIHGKQEKAVCLRAELLYKKLGKTEVAISLLQKFINQAAGRRFGEARILLSEMFLQSGAYKKAIDEALKIKETGPITDKLYILIGNIQSHLNQYGNAIDNFKFATLLAPHNSSAYIELAKVYTITGKPQEAINILSEAMERVGEREKDALIVEVARVQISLGHYVAAREVLGGIQSSSPYLERSQYLITQSYLKQNDYTSAEESLTRFLKQNKGRNWAILAMARIFELAGNKTDVENWIKKNIQISENSNELEVYLNKKNNKPSTRLPAGAVRSETVKAGDNLHIISMRIYGHTGMWENIYKWNRDTIENPNLLIEGSTLKICKDEKCEN